MQRGPEKGECPVVWHALFQGDLSVPSCFGSRALRHLQPRICSDMWVRDHVLLTLDFSARAGSCPAGLGRTAASMWLTASQGVCVPMGRPFPYLQKQQYGCATVLWRWGGTWGSSSLHSQHSADPLCTEFHWYSQKDEMALLPKLHLKRVVIHSICKTYSDNFSIPLFLKKVTNKQCICLGFTSVRPASSVGTTCSILLPNIALCRVYIKGTNLLFIVKARPNVSFSE